MTTDHEAVAAVEANAEVRAVVAVLPEAEDHAVVLAEACAVVVECEAVLAQARALQ